jgi:hypothetical protein
MVAYFIDHAGVTARTADLEVVKLLLQSVPSERLHKPTGCMSVYIKDFYLGTPTARKEYIRISLKHLSPDAILDLGLAEFIHNGSVLFEIGKCMYGLPHAGLLSQQRLVAHLAAHGYHQVPYVPCLFRHTEYGTTSLSSTAPSPMPITSSIHCACSTISKSTLSQASISENPYPATMTHTLAA